MINPDKRKAIYCLHLEGMGAREIARRLGVNRDTVRTIIDQKGEIPVSIRCDKIEIDSELLLKLYNECGGYVQRMHEKLTEEENIKIGYSTLTRMVRELEISQSENDRCDQVPDEPGKEMQHDTSDYRPKIGDNLIKVIASLLYFRYSKVRYLKFYRSFNRFKMKCFFHEALTFWKYAAKICIIDNTNLARLKGTGRNAVIVPEMKQFGDQYGFEFICHEVGHSDRKAGNERSFRTVTTNFFPGRTFESMEDLNQQAFEWATVRMPNRPVAGTRLIPSKAFEFEKPYLNKLPTYIMPPYLVHERGTDQYGYAMIKGNFYWVPGTKRHDVTVLQYGDHLKIYHKRKLLGEYELPQDGVKNEKIYPKGQRKPVHQPKYRKKPTAFEEEKLRTAAREIDVYLTFVLKQQGVKQKHRFIRHLFGLYQKMALSLFIKTIERALTYRITDVTTIERIAVLQMKETGYQVPLVEIHQEYKNRESYLQGCFSDEVDLSIYDKLLEDDDG